MVIRWSSSRTWVVPAVLLGACVFMQPAIAQNCEVKLGVAAPMTGGAAAWGLAMKGGTEFEAAMRNAEGGVQVGNRKCKVVVSTVDTLQTAAGAAAASQNSRKPEHQARHRPGVVAGEHWLQAGGQAQWSAQLHHHLCTGCDRSRLSAFLPEPAAAAGLGHIDAQGREGSLQPEDGVARRAERSGRHRRRQCALEVLQRSGRERQARRSGISAERSTSHRSRRA